MKTEDEIKLRIIQRKIQLTDMHNKLAQTKTGTVESIGAGIAIDICKNVIKELEWIVSEDV